MKKKPEKKSKKPKRGRPKTSASGNILSERETEVLNQLKEGKQYEEYASRDKKQNFAKSRKIECLVVHEPKIIRKSKAERAWFVRRPS